MTSPLPVRIKLKSSRKGTDSFTPTGARRQHPEQRTHCFLPREENPPWNSKEQETCYENELGWRKEISSLFQHFSPSALNHTLPTYHSQGALLVVSRHGQSMKSEKGKCLGALQGSQRQTTRVSSTSAHAAESRSATPRRNTCTTRDCSPGWLHKGPFPFPPSIH